MLIALEQTSAERKREKELLADQLVEVQTKTSQEIASLKQALDFLGGVQVTYYQRILIFSILMVNYPSGPAG